MVLHGYMGVLLIKMQSSSSLKICTLYCMFLTLHFNKVLLTMIIIPALVYE